MALPVVAVTEYSLDLPSSGKKIKIRPFMAQEEKILLMAMESIESNPDSIKESLLQVIRNCVLTKGVVVEKLPNIDIEKIFIELRRRTVGDTIDFAVDLRKTFDCASDECPEVFRTVIKLDSIELRNFSREQKKIMLTDSIGVTLKSPTIADSDIKGSIKTEMLFKLIASLIDVVFDGEEIMDLSDTTPEDMVKWVERSFTHDALQSSIEFLDNQPYFHRDITISCKQCGKEKIHTARGLVDFFI